jgi:uncharacterized protein YoxC
MDMIIKSKDKHGNIIEFNPKGRGSRYTVNGLKKKGVTTIIGERFGKGALMWWAENCVFEALHQKLKYDKKAVDEVQQFVDDLKNRVKAIKENASNIGTNMHSLCEDYITGKNPVEPTTEPLKTMFDKFKKFWNKKMFKVIATEMTVYSEEVDACGTTDLVAEALKTQFKGKKGIIDFKTSKDFYPDMPVQIHTYKKLVEDSTDYKIEFLAVINIPKEPVKDVTIRFFDIKPRYLKAFKACKYLNNIEEEFKKRNEEYNKIRR